MLCLVLASCLSPWLLAGCVGGHHPSSRTVALLDDKVIQDNVKASLKHASATAFSQVQVVSANGVVTLSGSVPDDATKAKAAQIASQVPQVRQVENNLQVRESSR